MVPRLRFTDPPDCGESGFWSAIAERLTAWLLRTVRVGLLTNMIKPALTGVTAAILPAACVCVTFAADFLRLFVAVEANARLPSSFFISCLSARSDRATASVSALPGFSVNEADDA